MGACTGGGGSGFGVWSIGNCGCTSGSACQINTTVTTCAGADVVGATVTVTQSGTTIGTDTTDSTGQACVGGLTAGTYNVSAAKAGYSTSNVNVTVTCPGTMYANLVASPSNLGFRWLVTGCNGGPLPGATLSINGGNYTTDSSGYTPYVALPNGSYTWTLSKARFVGASGSGTVSGCSTTGGLGGAVTLTPASGYTCALSCVDPIATTLYVTCAAGSLTCTSTGGGPWTGCGTLTGLTVDNCSGGTTAGSAAWAIQLAGDIVDPVCYLAVDMFTETVHEAVTWTACASLSYNCPTNCYCTLSRTPATSPTTLDCPPSVYVAGTFSGLTGLFAIFNGAWAVTE